MRTFLLSSLFSVSLAAFPQQPPVLQSAPADYKLGAGDLIEVSVFGVEDLKQKARIGAAGAITLPLLGPVELSGLTPAEAESRIRDLLRASELVHDAQVTVFVAEFHSHSIQVLGAVNAPGVFALSGPARVTDALALAGGVDLRNAGSSVVVTRPGKPFARGSGTDGGPSSRLEIDLHQLFGEGSGDWNVALAEGDVIHVPERVARLFYVIGEVNKPGAFEIPEGRTLRITQAIAWAGGPMKTAKTTKGVLVRLDADGAREDVAVNFRKIIRGQMPDLELRPEDVLFIPGSTFKNIGYGLLGVVPRTLSDSIANANRP